MKRARHNVGSVCLDRRSKVWNFFWWAEGKRRSKKIGALRDFPTKRSAWLQATKLKPTLETTITSKVPTVSLLVEQYRVEKMPTRYSTRRGYESYLRHRILPRWGDSPLTDVQARPVQMWLGTLELAPKSKAELRGLIRILWDYAMWRGDVPVQRNPMSLV